MPKKNAFGKGKYTQRITSSENTSFTTAASKTVNKLTQALPLQTSYRPTKATILMSLVGWTLDLETGPIIYGIAANQYSATEIEQAIEENGPLAPTDDSAIENQSRRIWILGQVGPGVETTTNEGLVSNTITRTHTWKPEWTFTAGSDPGGWTFWYYNNSGSTMNAETKVLSFHSTIYGVWVL